MSYSQVNTTVVSDGVTLYQRNDHKVARWYYRLKFPDKSKHYIKSSGTIDFEKAKTTAITQYYKLLGKIEANVSIFSKPFSYVAEEFIKHEEFRAGLKEGISQGRLKVQKSVTRRWFMKYFENTKIDAIKTEDINDFWRWRLEYAKSAEAEKLRRRGIKVVRDPRSTTLNEEKISLNQLFNFAIEKGWLNPNLKPQIKIPVKVTVESRDHFTADAWERISTRLYYGGWAQNAPTTKRFGRHRVTAKVRLMAMSGIRVTEAHNLKWRDIYAPYVEPLTKQRYAQFYVWGKNKPRVVTADLSCYSILETWKFISKHTNPDDYVFCNEDGSPAEFDNAIFKRLLNELGLLKDKKGKNRTLTSLRHTYAVDRLLDGDVNHYLLAKAMGNTVRMIEQHYGDIEPQQKAAQLTRSKETEGLMNAWRETTGGQKRRDGRSAFNEPAETYETEDA
jgi:integrase